MGSRIDVTFLFLRRQNSSSSSRSRLLERDESGGVSGTDTGATVLHGLVGDGKFTEVVPDHLRLDFDLRAVIACMGNYLSA